MKKNILWWDRFVRFFVGTFMIAWAIAGGPSWGYAGIYFFATGSWAYDPIYSLLNYQPFSDDN
jgi:hypothetical protein